MTSSRDHIEALINTLKRATTFAMVFGKLSGTEDERRAALKRVFRAMLVHEDAAADADKALASAAFRMLVIAHKKAEAAIALGKYDEPFAAGILGKDSEPVSASAASVLRSKYTYQLSATHRYSGDLSMIYDATVLETGEAALVKIASAPTLNPMLEREAHILTRCHDPKAAVPFDARLRPFMPRLIETFHAEGDAHSRFRVLVFPRTSHVSVTEILKAHPDLDHRDGAWIARRVVGQTLVAAAAGVVHGAITPDHVLVEPLKHEPLHIGWAHSPSSTRNERITSVVRRWRHLYPPEVFMKDRPNHRTDVYMAAKTSILIFGGDAEKDTLPNSLPKPIAAILKRAVEKSPALRPTGAEFLEELTRSVREAWGKEYRPLEMPVAT